MSDSLAVILRSLRLSYRLDPWRVLLTLALSLVSGALPVVVTYSTKLLVDAISDDASIGNIASPIILLFVAMLLSQGLSAWGQLVEADLERRHQIAASDAVFGRLNEFGGLRHFEDPDFQDTLELGLGSGGSAHVALLRSAAGLLQQAVTLGGFLAALASVDIVATVLLALTAIPQFKAELSLGRARFGVLMEMTPVERLTAVYQRLQSDAGAAKESRLFNLGDFFRGRMLREMATRQRAQRRVDLKTFRVRAGMDLLALLPVAVALGIAVHRVGQGSITPGDIVLYLGAVTSAATASEAVAVTWALLREDALAASAYFSVVDTTPDIVRHTGQEAPALERLTLRDVWFRYRPDLPWVLRGVDLEIDAGSSLAVVGANGAGKSTLVKILCRLYDPERGVVAWNGVDIRTFDVDSVRDRLGAVFQDFTTYDLTVAENVALGDLSRNSDHAAVAASLDRVGLTATVEALPRGVNTRLSRVFRGDNPEVTEGESGPEAMGNAYLSGGQWQRLALARMLMRADRELLILDEPSSGLDPRAEAELTLMMTQATVGAARVLVSHRLNTIRFAERIVVLDDGVVIERGNHDTLMSSGGVYAEMFSLQREGYL